jgi:CheY-like chemotaxis protein
MFNESCKLLEIEGEMARKLKALVLEDNKEHRAILGLLLNSLDVEVTSFEDPTCFLKSCNTCPVDTPCLDFILTDNDMPNMTGVVFLEKLQQMNCKINVKRKAIMSGDFNNNDIERIEKLGVNIFHKPCSLDVFSRWIAEIRNKD